MLGAGYNSSGSEDVVAERAGEEGEEEDAEAAEVLAGGVEEDDDSDEDEDEDDGSEEAAQHRRPLPSVGAAFAAIGKEDLKFKKFAQAKEKQRRVRAHTMSLDGVPATSAATLRGQGWQPTTAGANDALPSEAAAAAAPAGEKRPAEHEEAAGSAAAAEGEGGKGKAKGKMTTKEKTKLKRFKGQSGADHSGRMWKPEVWMKIRQEFD